MIIKKISIAIILISSTLFISCENAEEVAAKQEMEKEELEKIKPSANAFLSGTFNSASGYTTTGKAEVVKVSETANSLVFTNFRTSNGPDLRVYLAEDTKAKNFIEITNKVENGSSTYELPSGVDLEKQKFVLIWCKAFSVNFGYVELKKL